MKYLLLLFLPMLAMAINPSEPVVRISNNKIVEKQKTIPDRYGSTINYQSAGNEQWRIDGWRQAIISQVTNVTIIEIPTSIQAVAAAYKNEMENIYGIGATTNTNLTHEYVSIDLSLNTNITADMILRLSTWFNILDGYWQRGEIWTFPYDESQYSITNIYQDWKAQD